MLNIQPQTQQFSQAVRQGYLDDLRRRERAKMHEYIKAREYYDGVHYTQLTDRMREFLNVNQDADFTVNYCPLVVNAKADRLEVDGFDVEAFDESDTTELEATTWKWWRRNRMDRKQGIVHRAAIRDGDAFVLVEWDNDADMPRFHFEPAYAGDGVMVYYSDERRDEIEFASKAWRIRHGNNAGKQRRLNLYFADRIEKYISSDDVADGQYIPFEDEDTNVIQQGYIGMAGVTWWTDDRTQNGNPLGVPVVHFKDGDTGDGFGTSHLAKVIPVQDALNKSMLDLLGMMDTEGFGLLVGTGTTAWADAKVGPGAIAAVNKPKTEADFNRLPGGNPVGMLAVYDTIVKEIARLSGTPLSYLQSSGQVAAEGTMKQQETALVSQVKKAQADFGNAWEQCLYIGIRLHNVFSDESAELSTDIIIDTVWQDAESRNEKEQAETLAIKVTQLGVSEEQAQSEMGYDATKIAEFKRSQFRNQALGLRQQARLQSQNGVSDDEENLTQTENETNDQPRASPAA